MRDCGCIGLTFLFTILLGIVVMVIILQLSKDLDDDF